MKKSGLWELIRYQSHPFLQRGDSKHQDEKYPQRISVVTHTLIHKLFMHHPSIYLAIIYPFFIHYFKHQQFIHHPFTIHLTKHPFILHLPSLPYPSLCIRHQTIIHLCIYSIPISHQSIYCPHIHSFSQPSLFYLSIIHTLFICSPFSSH